MVVCSEFINVLDLECFSVYLLAGSNLIWYLIMVLGIISLSAKFRFSNAALTASIFLFALMFYTTAKSVSLIIIILATIILVVSFAKKVGGS